MKRQLHFAVGLLLMLLIVLVDFTSHFLSVALDGILMCGLAYIILSAPEKGQS